MTQCLFIRRDGWVKFEDVNASIDPFVTREHPPILVHPPQCMMHEDCKAIREIGLECSRTRAVALFDAPIQERVYHRREYVIRFERHYIYFESEMDMRDVQRIVDRYIGTPRGGFSTWDPRYDDPWGGRR